DVPTVPGPGGHVDVLDDVPVAHNVSYTSFFGDDSKAPVDSDMTDGHAFFTNSDAGAKGYVDEDWLPGQKAENNVGNRDQDNDPAGSNSDSAHGDDLGRTYVTGNLDIDFGADGPAGATIAGGGGNDFFFASSSVPTTVALGLDNVPGVGDAFKDANGNQMTSGGHDLVVIDHYTSGGLEHLVIGYTLPGEGGGDALVGSLPTVSVFELTVDVNPDDHDGSGLDFQDFKFELFKGIDQPNNPGGAEPTEGNTQLHFDVTGHDDDGDAVHTGIN